MSTKTTINALFQSYDNDDRQDLNQLRRAVIDYVEKLASFAYQRGKTDGLRQKASQAELDYLSFVETAFQDSRINIFEPEFDTPLYRQTDTEITGPERFNKWFNERHKEES